MKFLFYFANWFSNILGKPGTILILLLVTLGFLITGRTIAINEKWFSVFEIVLSLIIFKAIILQTFQIADTKAMQQKLDEVIAKLSQTNKTKTGLKKNFNWSQKV